MIDLTVQKEIDVPAHKAWELIADFGNISWAPGMDEVEVIGQGVGMVRRIHMPGAEPIDEKLEVLDAQTRTMSYTIPSGLPMPVTGYRATARVIDLGGNRCRIDWHCSAQEDGVSAEEATNIVRGFYDMLLGWIAEHLQKA